VNRIVVEVQWSIYSVATLAEITIWLYHRPLQGGGCHSGC